MQARAMLKRIDRRVVNLARHEDTVAVPLCETSSDFVQYDRERVQCWVWSLIVQGVRRAAARFRRRSRAERSHHFVAAAGNVTNTTTKRQKKYKR